MADGAKEHASSASSGAMSRSNDAISMILEAPNHFEVMVPMHAGLPTSHDE
jgi:hypothetical protein